MRTHHTPTPWKYTDDRSKETVGTFAIRDEKSDKVAECAPYAVLGWKGPEEAEANAKFIVRACNTHEDLINVLKKAQQLIHQKLCHGDMGCRQECEDAGKILSEVEGHLNG